MLKHFFIQCHKLREDEEVYSSHRPPGKSHIHRKQRMWRRQTAAFYLVCSRHRNESRRTQVNPPGQCTPVHCPSSEGHWDKWWTHVLFEQPLFQNSFLY